uniref:ATP synthase F0 subunit 8 n=1 Tax=Prionospio multibranchiata TaxID=3050093 RepID=A0AAU6QGS2_9ANNE
MPQLAPLSWALAPMLFWVILLALASAMWWSNDLSFPTFSASSSSKFSTWDWA